MYVARIMICVYLDFQIDVLLNVLLLVNLVFTNCKPVLDLSGIVSQSGWEDFHNLCMDTSGSVEDKPIFLLIVLSGMMVVNTCSVTDGGSKFFSRRMCLTMGEQSCRKHHDNMTTTHESRGDCFNGIDDDNDGLADCDDPDCRIYGRCRVADTETGRECFDGLDNDEDGLTDCMDDDCMKDPRAQRRCATFVRPIVVQSPMMMPPVSAPNNVH